MDATTASLIAASALATAWMACAPERDDAVWSRSGVACVPAATRAVPSGYRFEPVLGTQTAATPCALPDARNVSPSCMPQKVIRT